MNSLKVLVYGSESSNTENQWKSVSDLPDARLSGSPVTNRQTCGAVLGMVKTQAFMMHIHTRWDNDYHHTE